MTEPDPICRPGLAEWMFERGLKLHHAAHALGCSSMTVSRFIRPFGHPERRIPDETMMAKIAHWTRGDVKPVDFYPPHLNQVPAPAATEAGSGAAP